ncbi:MAG: hypothetical protein RL497_1807 [Pseudomonadota bacterium]|jgi:hypothetical protein
MSSHNDVYIYTVTEAGRTRRLASMLPEEATRAHGIKNYAIVGEFSQNPGEEEVFTVNPAYIEFLSWAIARHVAQCPGLVAEAQKQQNGRMLITDARGRAQGHELTEDDVIGVAEIKDGKLTQYAGNQNYRPFNQHGFMVIEPWLNQKIREELLVQATRAS